MQKKEEREQEVESTGHTAAWRWIFGPRHFGFLPRLLAGLLLLSLLVAGLAVWSLQQSLLKYEEGATTEARNLAQLLRHDISTSVRSADLVLQATVAETEFLAGKAGGQPDERVLNFYIERQLALHPDLEGLRVADEHGLLTHGTGVAPGSRISIAERDYFKRLSTAPDAGLVVFLAATERNGTPVLGLARAVRKDNGALAGVLLVTMPLARFTAGFAELAVGKGSVFTLLDDEFRLVTRYPEEPGWTGRRFGSPALRQLVGSGRNEGVFRTRSTIDGTERVFAYHRLAAYGLHLTVGLATHDYLANWRDEVAKTSVLVLVFILATLVLYGLLYRAWKRQQTMAAALRRTNRTLAAEKFFSQAIFQSSPFAVYTRDRQGQVTAWNPAAEKLFGWREKEAVGHPLLTVPADGQEESERLRDRVLGGEAILELEVRRLRRDGTLFDMSTTLAPLRDASGEINGYLTIAVDITERKAAKEQIEFLAYRDVLTGLPNRLLLRDRFERAVAHADRVDNQVALLFIDLDNFKTVNDSLGHALGDALLKEVAARLGRCVRESDTISRQGGDEFLIVLTNLRGNDAITPVLLKIRDQLQEPVLLAGNELLTSASIGISIYPNDGRDFETLLQKADTAMYQAKNTGRNGYRFFDEQMNVEAMEHLSLKNGLRRAIERQEFVLHYQPQIDLRTGRIFGAEALLRWNHPEQGMISPARFIPVAEDSGLIVSIGEWVIGEACRQAMAWQRAGLPELVVAVNLSAVQFRRGDVEQSVVQALRQTGLDPRLLELELTESILIQNPEQVLGTVRRLKQLGVTLAIDDFGTGYSSLSYLKRFDVDKLKIDQSFVRDLASDPGDAAIVQAVIQMAHSLNLKTLAEGVEDAEMLTRLRQFACDDAQGYYFSRPLEAQAFVDFFRQQRQAWDERWGMQALL